MKIEDVKVIAVLGAGTMGHGIAQLAAMAGYKVYMRDIAQEFLDRGMDRIRWSLGKLVSKGRISKEEADRVLERITPTIDLKEAVEKADFVIEAIPEKIELKKQVFSEVDQYAPRHAILATNTSSLPITEIASATGRPEKVVGMHFFNPPQIMRLVEIIRGEKTSDETVRLTAELARRFGKEVVLVNKDVPGFIVNRILARLMNEACLTVERGEATVVEVDSAIKYKVGTPMGMMELADFSGVDVFYLVMKAMQARGFKIRVCRMFEELYEKGWYGIKAGRGFYQYKGEKYERAKIPKEAGEKVNPIPIFAPAINEAAWLVRTGVATVEDIDKAIELGLNFPKGVLKLADEWGIDTIVSVLREKVKKYGDEVYEPDPLLVEMVEKGRLGMKSGEGFYKYELEETVYETIKVRKEGPLAWVILNRPDKLNAVNLKMISELDEVIDKLSEDERVRVVILMGAGERAFSAGADISTFKDVTPLQMFKFSRMFQSVLSKLEDMPKPVIAAINGYALGGGLELAMACDLRYASEKALLGQPEIKLGIIPGAGGTQRLTRLVGPGKAKELIMFGNHITAAEAEKIGLVNKVLPSATFEAEVRRLASELAERPPIALMLAKYVIKYGYEAPLGPALNLEASKFGMLFSTEDAREGVDAFLRKRKARFKGR